MVDSLAPIGAALNRLSLADLLRGLRQPGITVSHRGSEVLCCVFRNFHTASADSPNHDTTRRAQPRWAVQQAASPMRPQPVSPCPATRSSGSEDSLLDRFHTRVASSGQRGQLPKLLDGISGLPSAEPPTTELLSPWLRALPVFLVSGHPLFSAYRSAICRADLVEEMGHYRAGSATRPH